LRKGAIIASLVSWMSLSAGSIIQVFTKLLQLSWLLITVAFVLWLAALILAGIYWYRQEQAREQQFKQWGMVVHTSLDLLRCKAEAARPYKREFWLRLVAVISVGFVMLFVHVVELSLPQIGATFYLIAWPCIPAVMFICLVLSRDLAKVSAIDFRKVRTAN
jgi:hypothetical protein